MRESEEFKNFCSIRLGDMKDRGKKIEIQIENNGRIEKSKISDKVAR